MLSKKAMEEEGMKFSMQNILFIILFLVIVAILILLILSRINQNTVKKSLVNTLANLMGVGGE